MAAPKTPKELLRALTERGISQGAVARKAGVSHQAAKHYFKFTKARMDMPVPRAAKALIRSWDLKHRRYVDGYKMVAMDIDERGLFVFPGESEEEE